MGRSSSAGQNSQAGSAVAEILEARSFGSLAGCIWTAFGTLLAVGVSVVVVESRAGAEIAIADVSRPQQLRLTSADPGVVALRVRVVGRLDGRATVCLDGGSGRRVGPGPVDALLQEGDYYGATCLVLYQPIDVRSGQLTIRYDFATVP